MLALGLQPSNPNPTTSPCTPSITSIFLKINLEISVLFFNLFDNNFQTFFQVGASKSWKTQNMESRKNIFFFSKQTLIYELRLGNQNGIQFRLTMGCSHRRRFFTHTRTVPKICKTLEWQDRKTSERSWRTRENNKNTQKAEKRWVSISYIQAFSQYTYTHTHLLPTHTSKREKGATKF